MKLGFGFGNESMCVNETEAGKERQSILNTWAPKQQTAHKRGEEEWVETGAVYCDRIV